MLARQPGSAPSTEARNQSEGKDWLILGGLAIAVLLVTLAAPRLFAPVRPLAGSTVVSAPPSALLLAVGLGVSLCTAGALYVVLRRNPRFPALAVGLAIAYNVLIVMVKFWLGPVALWQGEYTTIFGTSGIALEKGIAVFALYCVAYLAVAVPFLLWARKHLKRGEQAIPRWAQQPGIAALIAAGLIIFAGSLLLVAVSLVPALSGDQYLQLIFAGGFGVAAAVMVAATMTSGILAFYLAAARTIAIRDASLIATLFWTGLALLAIYHVLWVLYVVTLAAIWPLRIYVPK